MEIIIYSATKETGRGAIFMNCKRFKDTKGDGRDLLPLYYASNHLNGEKSHDSLKTRSMFEQVNTQIIKVFLKVGDNAASLNICCATFRGSEKFSRDTSTVEDETNTFSRNTGIETPVTKRHNPVERTPRPHRSINTNAST
jgi:hypothetical protein